MNILQAPFISIARRGLLLLAALSVINGLNAAEPSQPNRFLFIFETSPTIKKNLPAVRQALDKLFASNLQNEIQENDDLAVWTVDETLHTGSYPLTSWSAADAADNSDRLRQFLADQRFTRHASLKAIQPLLNRVVKNSERLTVVVFCDSQSQLAGTPYDSGVNEIITNTTAKTKSAAPFILVLRSYQGEYLGCSVNRSTPLNFPKFPPPPKPEPAPEPKVVAEPPPPAKPALPPVLPVKPVAAMIIVGTNYSTNPATLVKPSTSAPPAPPVAAAPPPAISNSPAPAPKIIAPAATNPPAEPPPAAKPAPVPVPAPKADTPVDTAPAAAPASNATIAPARPANTVTNVAEAENSGTDGGYLLPLAVGGGLLVAAGVLVVALVIRSRRPRGSLITSSLQDDPRLPPR